jgi:hypothetical protein
MQIIANYSVTLHRVQIIANYSVALHTVSRSKLTNHKIVEVGSVEHRWQHPVNRLSECVPLWKQITRNVNISDYTVQHNYRQLGAVSQQMVGRARQPLLVAVTACWTPSLGCIGTSV